MSMQRRTLLPMFAGLLLVGLAAATATIWCFDSDPPGRPATEQQTVDASPGNAAHVQPDPPLDIEASLKLALSNGNEAERLEALDQYAARRGARSDIAALSSAMLADSSGTVRVRAFEVARDLAVREDREAVTRVLGEGVNNPHGDVQRAAMRACRDHPRFELMDDLLEIAGRGGEGRSVAIQALAFLDDPEAQQRVLQAAQAEDTTKAERAQAVALLSRSSLPEAIEYLKTLAIGDDVEMRAIALKSLEVRQGGN